MTATTQHPVRSGQDKRAIDRWIPWIIVAGFLVVISANGIMIYSAMDSWPGLTTDKAYVQGLDYNSALEAERAQAALGWQVAVGQDGDALTVLTLDRDGETLFGAEVSAVLRRPVSEMDDVEVALTGYGDGKYRADLALPLPGVWDAFVTVAHGEDTYVAKHRVFIEP